VELFDDNPVEFIRRDIEGSDNDTRRRTASDLVRALSKQSEQATSQLCLEFITSMLTQYAAEPAKQYVKKDGAVALVIALTVKATTAAAGGECADVR
jgi:exportin-2 (importin alpha re-exporter)